MFWAEAQAALKRSLLATARAFLVSFGEAPEDDAEVLGLLLSNAGSDADLMKHFNAVQGAMMSIDLSDPAAGVTKFKEAQAAFVALAEKRFAAIPESKEQPKEKSEATKQVATSEQVTTLDLSGVACPMNFVKTKIKLATMPVGAQLLVILDDGEPIENVPLSLEEQGHKVIEKKQISDTQWQIVVEKSV